MAKCLIFCAGGFHGLLEPVRQDDYLIAADGGLRHLETLGLRPHSILGDFDSLGHVPEGATVFPVEKDDTDAMLAVRQGLRLGYREFLLYGGMEGPRLDHTVANLQTLAFLADHGAVGFLTGEHQTAAVIRSGELRFPSTTPGTLSVFCLGPDAKGVDLVGLKYPLEGGSLTAGFPLGVSNQTLGGPATVRVAEGRLLVIWDRALGLPEVNDADL